MARAFGKIFASQWDDEDFLTLGADAKYVYDFLVAQSDLGHSGIITLRVAPWARRLSKTIGEVEAALRELHQRRYIVADDDEMLLLVRSLIRRDDVYKQPNVFKSAASQIYACPSKPIRAVLLSELERLDESAMKGDTVQVCADLVAWLRKTCRNPSPNPSGGGSRNPQSGESPNIPESGQAPDEQAGEEGSANPSGNPLPRVRVDARVPLPLPLPLAPSGNAHHTTASAALFGDGSAVPDPAAGKPQPQGRESTAQQTKPKAGKRSASEQGTRIPDDFRITPELDAWGREHCPHIKDPQKATDEFIDYWRGVGGTRGKKLDWAATWRNRMRELEERAVERLPANRAGVPSQRPSADTRVSATTRATEHGMDLIRQVAERDGVDLATILPFAPRRELGA